tara:strand:+ start:5600 stop:5854 length:255 start_codon:yes stop_codon:yes gene_type:complete
MITHKKCRKCKNVKALTEFDYNSVTLRRSRTCTICYNATIKGNERSHAAIDRAKAIMAVPINPKATHHYYMVKNPMKKEQEIGV